MENKNGKQNDEILALIKAHESLLRHTIQSRVRNPVDMDDVFQETVLVIIEHFRKGGQVKHPKAWMVKIAKNKCIDFHRRDKGSINRDVDLAPFISRAAFGGGVSIADEQHQAIVAKEIHGMISEVKSIYREVGELYIQGYTIREISRLLEIPEGTVKSRIRKFRQLIEAYLQVGTPMPK